MKTVHLSKRMEAVVRMVPTAGTAADIGCDHAYVAIALVQRKIVSRVIASDVREGPLAIACENVRQFEMEPFITLRCGSGLATLAPGEADVLILAGMGGLLMRRLLTEGADVLRFADGRPVLVLQPQSDIELVRRHLYAIGYEIEAEEMLTEDGKYYTVLRATAAGEVRTETAFSPEQWVYGACNLERRSEVLYAYLEKERHTLQKILTSLECAAHNGIISEKAENRRQGLKRQLDMNQAALQYYVQR